MDSPCDSLKLVEICLEVDSPKVSPAVWFIFSVELVVLLLDALPPTTFTKNEEIILRVSFLPSDDPSECPIDFDVFREILLLIESATPYAIPEELFCESDKSVEAKGERDV